MLAFLTDIWSHRNLVWRLTQREIEARFRGSFLGLFWAVIVPLFMLGVFSLVFGTIFQSRWARPEGAAMASEYSFPIILFSGLIVFGILADPLNRAPGLVMENVAYVKKVVFPLEILPLVALISALVTAAISFAVFLVVFAVIYGLPPVTIVLLPLTLLPLMLFVLGAVYFLSSLGVFLRDLRHIMPPLTTAMLFLSSVFYSPENLPEDYRWLLYLNPVTPAVTYARDVIFWGRLPDLLEWSATLMFSLLVLIAGVYWFMRTEKAFADVV
ncbi:ABC transporter permease [Nitratireductor thuwali]|uniref:Transport permease protein n=1 Tax=Nitratireductor thuwali TaxID=2267699 RepID=A0ABY5MNN7_9HYPH|nr:Teichoic acid translocation permease protein TagG [Nitratireductor thuwali]